MATGAGTSSESAGETFLRNVFYLGVFTAIVAFLIYVLIKLTSHAEKRENAQPTAPNTSRKDSGGRGSISEGKGGKKKKLLKARERKPSKQDHNPDTEWLQTNLKGHSGEVLAMAFSPNFKYLASVGTDRVVFLWHTKNFSAPDHTQYRANLGFDSANMITFSPDSKAFMVAKTDNSIEVYKIAKKTDLSEGGSRIQVAVKAKTDHTAPIVGIGIHPKCLVTCDKESRVALWSFKGAIIGKHNVVGQGKTNVSKMSLCGRLMAFGGKYNDNINVFVMDVAQELDSHAKVLLTGSKPVWTKAAGEIVALDWSRDSSKIVALAQQAHKLVWRVYDLQGIRPSELCTASIREPDLSTDTENPSLPVVRFSADGFLLMVGAGNEIYFFSVLMGGLAVGSIADVNFESPIRDLTFGEGDKYLVSCGDKTVRLFNNIPGKRETLRHMQKQVGDKSTGTAMRSRLKIEIGVLEDELRPYNNGVGDGLAAGDA